MLEIERLLAAATVPTSSLTVALEGGGAGESGTREEPGHLPLARIVHEVARALTAFPELNAAYADGALDCYQEVNVGIAIDLGRGVRVPVIRNADTLTPGELQARVLDLLDRYRRRRLAQADTAGGTVTVSDLSRHGIAQLQPLLNRDQVLAIGIGGDPDAPRRPMTITAVFDHRASSGLQVATFLGRVRQRLLPA
jgi:pyruvate dehydrogenase E2 component (dihydrolipoamide acetyltransferase)/2-oxoglutarate dehydrogenase E2 component (dihydrolipoamide succinyltransferase)